MMLSSFSFFRLKDNSFYNANYNVFLAPQINDVSIYAYVYLLILMLVTVCFFWNRFKGVKINAYRYLLNLCWVFCLVVILLQASHQFWYLNAFHRKFEPLTDSQRQAFIFGNTYHISNNFASRVPQGALGLLLFDKEIRDEVNVRFFSYFMFPRLDLVHQSPKPDYLVFCFKADKTPPVPGQYTIEATFDEAELWKRTDDGR